MFEEARPNPSIERTSSSVLRTLPSAAHVQRYPSHMKRVVTALLAVFGLGASAQGPKPPTATVMAELRARALAVKPSDIGLAPASYANRPWGLLMETGLEDGAACSLVVLADGSTSLYYSSGGGAIGAGEHEAVHVAAKSMLEVANRLQANAQPASATPLPRPGKVQFYLLSAQGTLGYSADEQSLGEDKDRLSELFHAGHSVITQVRLAEQSRQRCQ